MKLASLFTFILFTIQLNAQMDTLSYSVGVVISKNLKSQGISELDLESFNKAIQDVFNGDSMQMSLEEANQNVQDYMSEKKAAANERVIKEGAQYLINNKERPEVRVTESGLQYEILTKGTGEVNPTLMDKVKVHYHGTLIDGTVFDSSVDRGEPIEFPLNGVIPGWQEGVQLMTVGAKFRFVIPYSLAYGERGAGPVIKPFSTLIFEVELLEIQ